jgi:hypothetical protein
VDAAGGQSVLLISSLGYLLLYFLSFRAYE